MTQKPDSGIKKVTLTQNDIGAMYTESQTVNKYFVRYRIVSDDGALTSKWSQIHSIDAGTVVGPTFGEGYTVVSDGNSMTVSWKLDNNVYGSSFDAYARWNEKATRPLDGDAGWSSWGLVAETSLSSFSAKVATGKVWVQFYLQRRTFPQTKTEAAKIFQTAIYPTRSTTDGGPLAQQ